MKKSFTYIVYILIGGLTVCIIAYLGFIAWLSWRVSIRYEYSSTPSVGNHTADTTLIRYKIGSYRFNVPANYTLRLSDKYPVDVVESDSDLIEVLWPDLEPYTKKQAQFAGTAIKNKIYFSMLQIEWYQETYDPSLHNPIKPLIGALTPEDALKTEIYHYKQRGIEGTYQHDKKVPKEFIYFPESKASNEKKPILGNFYAVLDGNENYLFSARCTGEEDKGWAWLGQHCDSFFKYNDEIYIRYQFDFNMLKNWQQIEPKPRELIASFEQAAQEETDR